MHRYANASKSVVFWAAYVLTRPLGATLGDTLTKPFADGSLNLGRMTTSGAMAVAMMILVAVTSLRVRPTKAGATSPDATRALESTSVLVSTRASLPSSCTA